MADMKVGDEKNYPLEPQITLEMSQQPANNNFSRYLTFEDHTGAVKRLKVKFKKSSGLTWESDSFPNGIGELRSLVHSGNRSYWDNIFLENRGGSTTLPIKHLKIVMLYDNPPGHSPDRSDHIVNGLDLSQIDHAEIPIVDWEINMDLFGGHDKIALNEFRKRTLFKWAGVEADDPDFVKAAVEDFGKSGSDGNDQYPGNPKFGGALSLLCSEFVSWYYHQEGISVNGQSLANIVGTQELHTLFKREGKLYRYNSGNNLQDFVHATTREVYIPKSGDYLERRGPNGAEHSMIIYRWLPKDTSSSNSNDRDNQALVINGPWPVTLRLVRIHRDEKATGDGNPKDYWLGRID
ncbi:MAG: hypothetical protein AAGC85_00475 [Bacteroidota bacterium]